MDAFPAFFSLSGRLVVVAGDGAGADAKARLFAASPASLVRLTRDQALVEGAFEGALLAFIAGDEAFCRQAATLARDAGALVNVVDRPALSDFNTPAVVDRGEVVVGIGTGGSAPMLAALLRNDLEARIPEGAGRVAALFRRMQDEIRDAFPDLTERRAFLRTAFTSPAAEAAAASDMVMAERLLRDAISQPHTGVQGRISLLRGDGPAEQLSLKAARILAEADLLVADEAASADILTLVRRDAERAAPSSPQALADLARGRHLVRIVDGPVEDLAEALRQAGADVEILPVVRD